jgi:hypothetical protein
VVNSHLLYQLSYRGIVGYWFKNLLSKECMKPPTKWLIPPQAGLYQLSYRGSVGIKAVSL